MSHPTPWEFHPVHHPSYIDFFEEVLADTKDPHVMSQKWEKQYAEDDWYRHLYRTTNAYHGVHPFYMWYWGSHAMKHIGKVIIVGGDAATVRKLGFTPASTMNDALDQNLRRAQRAAGVAEDAIRRAAMPLRNFGFPYRAPTVPRGVEVPPEVSGLGAHYDTDWARRPLASSVRTLLVEGPVRLAARVLTSPEIVGTDRLADLTSLDDPPAVIFARLSVKRFSNSAL